MRFNLATAAASLAMLAASGALAQPQWKLVGTQGNRLFVVVEPTISTDANALKQAAMASCTPNQACVVAFWSDAAVAPSTMPISRHQQQAMVAQYVRNPASGKEELLLKCTSAVPSGTKCLR